MVAGCTDTRSQRTSSAPRPTCCASRKALSTPACTAWPRKAGCARSGVRRRRTARRASTPSPRRAGSSSRSRKRAGRGCAAAWGVYSDTPEPSHSGGPPMSWLARLRNVFRADEVSEEIEREMAFHLAERTDELVAAGASPEAARREAERRFGSDLLQRDNTRDRDVLVWLQALLR